MKCLLAAALILSLVPTQTDEQKKLAKEVEKRVKKFYTEYNKFTDSTVMWSGHAELQSEQEGLGSRTTLVFGAQCKGASMPCESPRFILYFRGESKDWRFVRSRYLIILADDTRFPFEDVRHDGKVAGGESRYSRVHVIETMKVDIGEAEFEKISKAANLELQLGSYQFKVKPADVATMAEFLKRAKS